MIHERHAPIGIRLPLRLGDLAAQQARTRDGVSQLWHGPLPGVGGRAQLGCCVRGASVTGAPLATASPTGCGCCCRSRICCCSASIWACCAGAVSAWACGRRLWLIVVVVYLRHFGLEDAHGSAQRPGGVRHLPGAEQDKHHNRDNQYFQWAVEQVTYVHLSPHSGGKRVPAPWVACIESLHKTAPGGTAQAYWASAAAASSRISAARSAGEVTRPSSPSRSASRRTIRVSGVRSPTCSRPSPRSVTRSQG